LARGLHRWGTVRIKKKVLFADNFATTSDPDVVGPFTT
jgi:hypothetical protein